jgi:hypothetical protein
LLNKSINLSSNCKRLNAVFNLLFSATAKASDAFAKFLYIFSNSAPFVPISNGDFKTFVI